jgi:hypothetical protein
MPPVLEQAEQDLIDAEKAAEKAEQEAEAKRQARGDYVENEDDPDALESIAGDDDKPHEKAVPYARFNEVATERDKERDDRLRAEGERDALRRQIEGGASTPAKPKEPALDVEALRDQANEAMIEGDTDKANTLRRQANAAEREQVIREAEERALTRMRAEEGQKEIARAARAVLKEYPFLDSNNAAEQDPEAIEMVVAERDKNMRTKGMSPGEALTAAANRVGKLILRERAIAAKGNGHDEDEEPPTKRRDPAADRQTQAIVRGANAATRQPAPPIGGKGDRAAQMRDPDPSKMTDAEFEKLTPAEKSRLRGDVVE